MGPTWLLASCHKEEATARVLKKNMARKVEVAKLLRNRSRGHSLGKKSSPYLWHPLLPYQTLSYLVKQTLTPPLLCYAKVQ